MKKYLKILFVLTGLAIIGAGFTVAKDRIVTSSPVKDGQIFGDWVVNCMKNKDNDKKQSCFLSHKVIAERDNKKDTIAFFQFGYFGEDKKLRLVEIVPLGVNLDTGTNVIIGEKLIAPGKFKVCDSGGCQALAEISFDDFREIINSTSNFVGVLMPDGKQVNYPLPSKGLKEGLEAIGK